MYQNATYLFVYLSICAFFFIASIIVLRKLSFDFGTETEIMYFRRMLYTFIVYIASEVVDALGMAGAIPFSGLMAGILDTLEMTAITIISVFWFVYSGLKLGLPFVQKKKNRCILFIPLLVIVLLCVTSYWTGWIFDISEESHSHGPLYGVAALICFIFIVAISVYALVRATGEKSGYKRNEILSYALFAVPASAGAVAEAFVPNTPVLMCALFASILFIFIETLDGRVYSDALTGLNNRRSADKSCTSFINSIPNKGPFYLFLADIDSFKSINDTYGHAEGDRALVLMADAIKTAMDPYSDAFCARWGGDEFIFMGRESSITSPKAWMREIHQSVWRLNNDNDLPYTLSLSIGYGYCDDPGMDKVAVLDQADKMLYREKTSAHGDLDEHGGSDDQKGPGANGGSGNGSNGRSNGGSQDDKSHEFDKDLSDNPFMGL